MTTSTFNAKPVLGSLVLAALAIAAVVSLTYAWATPALVRDVHPFTLTQQGQTESHPQAGAPGHDVPPAAVGGDSIHEGAPSRIGIQRFADAEPGTSGPVAQQAASNCAPKRCPRPQ